MPKLYETQRLGPHLAIGVQRGTIIHDADKKGVWTARIQLDGKTKIKSTGIKYDNGSDTAKALATDKAYDLLEYEMRRRASGADIHTVNYAKHLLYKSGKSEDDLGYLEYIDVMGEENDARIEEGLEPTRQIVGGRAFYSRKKTRNTTADWNNYIAGFFDTLKRSHGSATVESITERELDTFDEYLLSCNNKLSVESRLKFNIELRRFLKWCKWRGYIDNVPNIKRPFRGGQVGARKRMRREITDDDYLRIIAYTRKRYTENTSQNRTAPYYRDFQYLFHLWVQLLANTGIRPPTGSTSHTLMKWEHLKIDDTDSEWPTLLRNNEKGHSYTAIIMPQALHLFEALRTFYSDYGMDTTEGYIFRHFYDNEVLNNPSGVKRGWRKGDPIWSFRSQWKKMCTALDLAKPNAPQSERVSPSSLRSYFITQRIYANVDIATLARVTGTSFEQIETRYFRLNVQQRHAEISKGGFDRGDKKPVYDTIDGRNYYVGHRSIKKD